MSPPRRSRDEYSPRKDDRRERDYDRRDRGRSRTPDDRDREMKDVDRRRDDDDRDRDDDRNGDDRKSKPFYNITKAITDSFKKLTWALLSAITTTSISPNRLVRTFNEHTSSAT